MNPRRIHHREPFTLPRPPRVVDSPFFVVERAMARGSTSLGLAVILLFCTESAIDSGHVAPTMIAALAMGLAAAALLGVEAMRDGFQQMRIWAVGAIAAVWLGLLGLGLAGVPSAHLIAFFVAR